MGMLPPTASVYSGVCVSCCVRRWSCSETLVWDDTSLKLQVWIETLADIMTYHQSCSSDFPESSLVHHRLAYVDTAIFTIRLLQTILALGKVCVCLYRSVIISVSGPALQPGLSQHGGGCHGLAGPGEPSTEASCCLNGVYQSVKETQQQETNSLLDLLLGAELQAHAVSQGETETWPSSARHYREN
ncbi:uncharacterized protein ACWYII_023172 isoform 1-T1 [Salvelinus alpinus]